MTSQVALRTARTIRARRSAILLYHGVGPTNTRIDPGFLRVRPQAFREQLDLLLEAGFETVTVGEFARRSGGRNPPPGLVALSFDDGMDDNHSVVLPLLREHGVRATVYVTTGLIGKPNPWMAPESGARMMTVDELRDLVAAGFEIGAHTVSHPDLSRLGFDECLREMRESRDELERTLGVEVRMFAYPSCHYSPTAVEAARAAGFTAAVTCHGRGSWKPYELRRSLVSGKDGPASFLVKLTGLYEPLSASPPGRIARAATRKARTMKRARAEARESRPDPD
jgi:peptidoglycan/xylan/chitin deacetylase (PgdA/CDA1 family)